MTYSEAYQSIRTRLERAGVGEAAVDAGYLVEFASGLSGADYLLRRDETMPEEQYRILDGAASRRESREPLQYITGSQEFMGLPFICSKGCLIPRLDTEILAEKAIAAIGAYRRQTNTQIVRVLDLCTGSGCVIISAAKLAAPVEAVGVDLSGDALDVARRNAAANGVEVGFVQSDLYEGVDGIFDIITANPPYVETELIGTLMPEVSEFEPHLALDGGSDGLVFYRKIAAGAPEYLRGGGRLLFEIGDTQGAAVSAIMADAGFDDVHVYKDLAGLDRVVAGQVWRKNV